MDYERQVLAYEYIETLVNDGHGFDELPITMEKAQGIISCRTRVSKAELRALRLAANKSAVTMTPVMQK